jgi:hypothetical protein
MDPVMLGHGRHFFMDKLNQRQGSVNAIRNGITMSKEMLRRNYTA